MLLARAIGARKILEMGTLGGYSTIWLARALLPKGRLVTLEADPDYAKVASANIARAGLERLVEIRVGRALDTLPRLAAEAPFDFIFIDADKPSTPGYFQWAAGSRGRARSSSWTTWCARAPSSKRQAETQAFRGCAASSSLPPPTRG
jgi:predicted O-methyltransferase YrrM